MRAEIALLTRRFVIRSDDKTSGCKILVVQDSSSRGTLKLEGVRVQDCGFSATKEAALEFNPHSSGLTSVIKKSAFVNSLNGHIDIN